jgi:hypothetical protein
MYKDGRLHLSGNEFLVVEETGTFFLQRERISAFDDGPCVVALSPTDWRSVELRGRTVGPFQGPNPRSNTRHSGFPLC